MMKTVSNQRPGLEWIVGGLSAIVVCGIVLFLGYQALLGDTRPPDLAVTIDRVEQVEGGSLIVVAISNRGDQAASDVGLEAIVGEGGSDAVTREIRFDFVASRSVRRGAFVVKGPGVDARDVRLVIHGYVEP